MVQNQNNMDHGEEIKENLLAKTVAFFKTKFSLEDDKAQRDEVVANISKGVEFGGVNLWILIFATLIASLGLNVNSVAVIIGAMLISPIMGPIMGMGLSLSINDFELFKRSLRNYTLMFVVAIITSMIYFLLSPLEEARSELLARTMPTTYDVLIAFVGGLAVMIAQSRRDRTSTVISGGAIATALIPPLCTAGYGLAMGELAYFVGAFYLFFINSVFIALATFTIANLMRYEKKVFIDKARERKVRNIMMFITLATFVPSVIIGIYTVRVSMFEAKANKYVANVFNYRNTRVVEKIKNFSAGDDPSSIELMLVGKPLNEREISHAESQLENYGLKGTKLVIRQASSADQSQVDVVSLQASYGELLDEKNHRIKQMRDSLSRYKISNIEYVDLSREAEAVVENLRSITLSKGVEFCTQEQVKDTVLVCVVTRLDSLRPIDSDMLERWLKVRTKENSVKLFVE